MSLGGQRTARSGKGSPSLSSLPIALSALPRPDPTVLLALPVAVPLAYLIWLAFQAPPNELLLALWRANLPFLLFRTASVAIGATLVAWLVAVPWAWLVARTDVPGRGLFRGLGPLPLAVPPYVGALVYALLLAPGGALHAALADWLGRPVGMVPFPGWLYGPAGAALVLGLFTAPHLFISVFAALQRSSPTLEEAARSLGLGPRAVLLRVTVPLLRPGLLAGSLLVFVYAWVDFGVVSLLRVQTFTTAIYSYLLAGYSLPASAALSLVLVGLVTVLLLAQRRALGEARFSLAGARARQVPPRRLERWRWPAFGYLCLVAALALGVPLGGLLWQASRLGAPELARFLGTQWGFLANTLLVSVIAATVVLLTGGLAAWRRWGDARGLLATALLQSGYAVPGTVLGLALAGLTLAVLPPIYATPLVLVLAYMVLFSGPAVQTVGATLAQVPRSIEESSRALGCTAVQALFRVIVPLAVPGLVGAWLLVFVLAMRELAATILLRPPGFDTLAVRIWVHTMDVGPDPRAAATALLLTTLTGAVWLALLRLQGRAPR